MTTQRTNVPMQSTSPLVRAPGSERKRITRWTKGVWAGVIAGGLFMTLEMFLIQVFGRGNMWDPVRLSASIAMGNRAVAASTPFTFDIFMVGMLVHFVVSIWYAVVLGLIIRRLKTGPALLVGAGFGLLLYFVHFYGLTFLYPWVANARNWIAVVAHLTFGVSVAWIDSHLHLRQLMRESGLPSEVD